MSTSVCYVLSVSVDISVYHIWLESIFVYASKCMLFTKWYILRSGISYYEVLKLLDGCWCRLGSQQNYQIKLISSCVQAVLVYARCCCHCLRWSYKQQLYCEQGLICIFSFCKLFPFVLWELIGAGKEATRRYRGNRTAWQEKSERISDETRWSEGWKAATASLHSLAVFLGPASIAERQAPAIHAAWSSHDLSKKTSKRYVHTNSSPFHLSSEYGSNTVHLSGLLQ